MIKVPASNPSVYRLHIRLEKNVTLAIGRLGTFTFPTGDYIYTGSAKRNIEARIARHLHKEKKLRWHIDYLLASKHASVTEVERLAGDECLLNQQLSGKIIAPGFGASDCRAGCGSHLKKTG